MTSLQSNFTPKYYSYNFTPLIVKNIIVTLHITSKTMLTRVLLHRKQHLVLMFIFLSAAFPYFFMDSK